MFLSRLALAAAAGVVAVSGAAAGQPINLLAPTPLAPTAPLPAPRSGMSLPMTPPATLPPAVVPVPPPVPMVTKALLPGRWQMGGWQYHWMPPETRLRTVETRPWVQGRYVWRDGAWTWVPSHYSDE